MPVIYNLAQNVCIWLGGKSDSYSSAMDFIDLLNWDFHVDQGAVLPKWKDAKYAEKWIDLQHLLQVKYFPRR
jgi:hypothetical protein